MEKYLICLGWTRQGHWHRMYSKLAMFHAKYGHFQVPEMQTEPHRWVTRQRRAVETVVVEDSGVDS